MEALGYYAMCKTTKNLYQFEHGEADEFYIVDASGQKVIVNINNYEIVNIGVICADDDSARVVNATFSSIEAIINDYHNGHDINNFEMDAISNWVKRSILNKGEDYSVGSLLGKIRDAFPNMVEEIEQNTPIEIYINGDWYADCNVDGDAVIIYDKGEVLKINLSDYQNAIDDLDDDGASWLCPDMFSHPNWNGEVVDGNTLPNCYLINNKVYMHDHTVSVSGDDPELDDELDKLWNMSKEMESGEAECLIIQNVERFPRAEPMFCLEVKKYLEKKLENQK